MSEKLCELKVNHCKDRASLVSILAFAGYKISIEEREEERWSIQKDYYVIVETK